MHIYTQTHICVCLRIFLPYNHYNISMSTHNHTNYLTECDSISPTGTQKQHQNQKKERTTTEQKRNVNRWDLCDVRYTLGKVRVGSIKGILPVKVCRYYHRDGRDLNKCFTPDGCRVLHVKIVGTIKIRLNGDVYTYVLLSSFQK